MSGAVIHFTAAQTDKLREVVDTFYERAGESTLIPGSFLLLLGGMRQIIHDEDDVGQIELNMLQWMLEAIFEQFEDDDLDPLLEQCYHKLMGYWYEGFDPWFIRMERLEKDGFTPAMD